MPLPGAVWPAIVRYGLRMTSFDSAASMRPRHVEDDGARPFGFDGRAQAAGAAVVEVGDLDHASAAAAAGEAAVAFGAGKRELPHAEAPHVALGDLSLGRVGMHFVDAPVVGGERVGGVGRELRFGLPAAVLGRLVRGGGDGRRVGAEIDVVGDRRLWPACQASVGRSATCSSPASGLGFSGLLRRDRPCRVRSR